MIDLIKFLELEKIEGIKRYSNGEWLNIVVGTARSKRHLSGVLKKIKSLKITTKDNIFGIPENEWVICSIGSVDIHLFLMEKREYYGIDQLWGEYELH